MPPIQSARSLQYSAQTWSHIKPVIASSPARHDSNSVSHVIWMRFPQMPILMHIYSYCVALLHMFYFRGWTRCCWYIFRKYFQVTHTHDRHLYLDGILKHSIRTLDLVMKSHFPCFLWIQYFDIAGILKHLISQNDTFKCKWTTTDPLRRDLFHEPYLNVFSNILSIH